MQPELTAVEEGTCTGMPLPDDLATRRAELELSLRGLGGRTGLSHSYIRALEAGTRIPGHLDVWQALCSGLECDFLITISAVTLVKGEPSG